MDTLDKDTVSNRYAEAYAQLVKEFCKDVHTIAEEYEPIPRTDDKGKLVPGPNRAPAPFLPIIGSGYYDAPIRVAIYGMETACWHDLSRFIKKYGKGGLTAVKAYTDGDIANPGDYKNRFHEHHGTEYENKTPFSFWKFVYSVLAFIYNEKDVRKNEKLLRSFIWGNVNAYEKFNASPKKRMKRDHWQKVFSASERFNSAQLLLPYTLPHIMVVFYWGMSRKWLTGNEGKWESDEKKTIDWANFDPSDKYKLKSEQKDVLKKYIRCFYLPNTGTYVFKTMHPQGMHSRHGKGIQQKTWMEAINYAIGTATNNLTFSHQS